MIGLNGKMLKDRAGIDEAFRNLTSDKPVVVFTTTGKGVFGMVRSDDGGPCSQDVYVA